MYPEPVGPCLTSSPARFYSSIAAETSFSQGKSENPFPGQRPPPLDFCPGSPLRLQHRILQEPKLSLFKHETRNGRDGNPASRGSLTHGGRSQWPHSSGGRFLKAHSVGFSRGFQWERTPVARGDDWLSHTPSFGFPFLLFLSSQTAFLFPGNLPRSKLCTCEPLLQTRLSGESPS